MRGCLNSIIREMEFVDGSIAGRPSKNGTPSPGEGKEQRDRTTKNTKATNPFEAFAPFRGFRGPMSFYFYSPFTILSQLLTIYLQHGIIPHVKSIAHNGTLIQRGGGTGPVKPRQPTYSDQKSC